jgi:Protein of unknown function (DUF2721)
MFHKLLCKLLLKPLHKLFHKLLHKLLICKEFMLLPSELSAVSQGIQLAIAPVFLLNAVAAMIGAVAGRLARIIDRARQVEAWMEESPDAPKMQRWKDELRLLRQRSTLVNWCIALLILCAILIGSTIVFLFFGETLEVNFARTATVSFMVGVVSFLLALICFFAETLLSAKILKIPN